MNITLNGQSKLVEDGATLESVLHEAGVPEQGVAAALNGAVVPRVSWSATTLRPDATVDVLTAVQGG